MDDKVKEMSTFKVTYYVYVRQTRAASHLCVCDLTELRMYLVLVGKLIS